MDYLALGKAHVVGFSLGARVAVDLALNYPHRVETLSTIAGTFSQARGLVDTVFFPGWAEVLRSDGVRGFLERWEQEGTNSIDAPTAAALLQNEPRAILALLTAVNSDDGPTMAELRLIKQTSLVIAGDRDAVSWVAGRSAADVLPGWFVGLKGADHFSVLSDSRTSRAVGSFLASQR